MDKKADNNKKSERTEFAEEINSEMDKKNKNNSK